MINRVFAKNGQIVKRKIAGEVFLVPVRQKLADMQRIFVLHGIGEFIWDRIDGHQDEAGLTEDIASRFEVSRGDALKDLAEILDDLGAAALIVTEG